MTVTSSTAKVSYAGNGSTTVFAVTFRFLQTSHIQATLRDAGGTETTWVLGTHYTLSGAGGASGTLTVKTSPTNYTPTSGETLVISRNVPRTQETDYGENDNFPAETHEEALDKLTMVGQQLDETIARALVVPVSDTAVDITLPIDTERSSKFLAFDATGQPIAAAGTSGDLTPVSAFIDTLLDDVDAATARVTLGAVGLTGNETIAGDKTFSGDISGVLALGGQLRLSEGAPIASANTLALGTDGNTFHVTGTNTINTITGYTKGTVFCLIADAGWTLNTDGDNIIAYAFGSYVPATGQAFLFEAHADDKCTLISSGLLIASQATMEAALSNTLAVTPGRMKHHPGVAKAWWDYDQSVGSPTIDSSYNIASITDNGVGDYTVNWDVDFSGASYSVVAMSGFPDSGSATVASHWLDSGTRTAGSFQVMQQASSGSSQDRRTFGIAFGDQ